ncbi:MAG: HAD family hydrolase [Clostridiaceae bacterium]|nr:HAD family hydrolase [Clostridiaceae bacterium]
MPIKTVIFDLDGTLLDTLADLADAVNQALIAESLQPLPTSDYRLLLGSGARHLVAQAAAKSAAKQPEQISAAQTDRLLAVFNTVYAENWSCQTEPYAGIDTVLPHLRDAGLQLAVLSNKSDVFTKQIIGHFFPDIAFRAVVGKRDGWPLKPDPATTFEILNLLDTEPVQAALVGDSGSDMETAVRAGMLPVGAGWGFRSAEELIAGGARKLAAQPIDLISILTG